MDYLNNTLNQQDLTEINRTLHTMISFLRVNYICIRIGYILGPKTNCNKYKRIEIIQIVLWPKWGYTRNQ